MSVFGETGADAAGSLPVFAVPDPAVGAAACAAGGAGGAGAGTGAGAVARSGRTGSVDGVTARPAVDTAGDASGRLSRSTRAASPGQPGSSRVRRKSSFVAASDATPMSASRSSITSASWGRPLSACARASRYIRAGSFRLPV